MKPKKKYQKSDSDPVAVRLNELKGPLMELSSKEDRSMNYLIKQAVDIFLTSKGYSTKK
jgi:hypothetical protein